ncbi:glycosyl hydrolase family 18 protein [Faecalicatena contorta]|uniref:glycosyl hydrolase family 18 protein n=1 Tax=Faecalicatena contorta TaxID=39482 RepID=UPI001F38CA08|nr:glycosyl hydrolase family 18 protein [Faecalicatena contorta]
MEEKDRVSRTTSDRRRQSDPRRQSAERREGAARRQSTPRREEGPRRQSTEGRQSAQRRQSSEERQGAGRRQSVEGRQGVQRRQSAEGRQSAERRQETARRPEAQPRKRRPQNKRRRKRNLTLKIAFLIILVIAAVAAIFLWKRYGPTKEQADLKKYYGIENENQLAVIVDDQVVEPSAMIADGKAYLRYETLRDYVSSRFYWDPNENILLYTLPKDMVSVEVGSKDYTVSKEKNSKDYVILKTEGSTAYIALDFVQQYVNIEYEVYDDPGRVMIVSDWGEKNVATVKKDTQVRYRGGVKSPVLTEISKKDTVYVIEDEENWKKVRTEDGFIGYVKKSALKNIRKENITREFEEQEFTSIKKDYTINMAWHNVTNSTANDSVLQRIADSKGLTTIVPTWFHVKDVKGNMDSIASSDYVNYAHQSNIEVWAAIRDFDGGIGSYDESFELLSHTSSRENLINQLVAESLQVGVDGINVDFEKISEECGEHYIQFIRELSVRCRQNGIILSVDNYVPKGYNRQYNRKEQGIVADYVVIMGYDEHFGGSPEAGPVSSYGFVKEGIEETLKEVPADKIISGIPFFTRLWEETPKTEAELAEEAGTEAAEYAMKVNSQPLGMSTAKEKIAQAGAEITWDEDAQQNYATWTVDGVTYEIWLEDEQSVEAKLKLMKENKLAGTAAWALGQESPDIWELILKYVN